MPVERALLRPLSNNCLIGALLPFRVQTSDARQLSAFFANTLVMS